MHVGLRFGTPSFSKNSGNFQDTSKKDCGFRVDVILTISATFSL